MIRFLVEIALVLAQSHVVSFVQEIIMIPAVINPSFFVVSSFVMLVSGDGAIPKETPFENVSAYSTILSLITASPSSMHPCATECAITPSMAFKSKYSCDIVNPVSCICGNKTRSVELRSSISDHCYNKCDWKLIPLATAVLDDYCFQNQAVQTQAPTTGSATQRTTLATQTTSASSTATNFPTPTKESNSLTVSDKATIVGVVLGFLALVVGVWMAVRDYRKDKRLGRDPWPNRTREYVIRTLFHHLRT